MRHDSWFDVISSQREPFIAKVFPDHEAMRSLGCGSMINMPVFVGGDLLGRVNCLDVEHQ